MNNLIAMALSLLMSNVGISEDEWSLGDERSVTTDGRETVLIRHVKPINNKLYGEHFSSLFTKDGKLLGFVLFQTSNNNNLIDEDSAKLASDKFLKIFAPDLLSNREILWIKPHDEILNINGDSVVIRGMKVKSINSDTGLYFWNIVDGDGNVFVFERDIRWLNLKGRRGTEKWLDDSWLSNNF